MIAGEKHARVLQQEAEVIEAMARRVDCAQGVASHAESIAVRDFVIENGHAAPVERVDGDAQACAQFSRAAHVIGMPMRHQDFAQSPAPLALLNDRLQVRRSCVRRIDHQRAIPVVAPQDNRVRARPRH